MIDELHHLSALNELNPEARNDDTTAWGQAMLPLLELATVRLLMSGTLQRADEGMDALGVAHIAALTYIRSRPWLEQLMARATRVDPQRVPIIRSMRLSIILTSGGGVARAPSLADYLNLLDKNPRYRFSATRRGHRILGVEGRGG